MLLEEKSKGRRISWKVT